MYNFDQIKQHLRGDTGRLAATYLVIIISLTLVFSTVIYSISVSQLDRPFTPRGGDAMSQFDDFTRSSLETMLIERAHQARNELLASLVLLNVVVLVTGAYLSYFLARKTLEPIEAAMETQAQFVSDASHELRTPLTALQVTNEVALRKKKLTLLQAKELIGYNLAETIKLRNLSESLLGLAKQGKANEAKSDISIPELVLDTVQTFKPVADEKGIRIIHDIPALVVVANASALTQILRILIDNALKYSPDRSSIRIAARQEGQRTTISVTDEGPGIKPEHQAKIFDRFYRVDESRSSRNVEGSGLGLAIAQATAERNGYDLTVTSTPGSGSTFSLAI